MSTNPLYEGTNLRSDLENGGVPLGMVQESLRAVYAMTPKLDGSCGLLVLTLDQRGQCSVEAVVTTVEAKEETTAAINDVWGDCPQIHSAGQAGSFANAQAKQGTAEPSDAVTAWLAYPKKVMVVMPSRKVMLRPGNTWREVFHGALDEIGWGV